MHIAIFGGTGFVGGYLVDAFLGHGHGVTLLARLGSEKRLSTAAECRLIPGDLDDEVAIAQTLAGAEAVVYNVGILREFPRRGIFFEKLQYEKARRVMDMAVELGVRRFLLTSANGVKADGTAYQRTKYLAGQYLLASPLEGTIFAPSVIFGDPRGRMEFATQLYLDLIRAPMPAPMFHKGIFPLGAGTFRLSPVHIGDVAQVYAQALTDPEAVGKIYPLCGPTELSWRQIIAIIGRAVGKNKWTMPAPVLPLKLAAGLLERFEDFPLTRDQLTMLMEGNTGDSAAIFQHYGITPTAFNEEELAYLRG